MPLFQPTEYLRPSSIDEVAEILVKYGETARIIGGGTEIYELAERGLLSEIKALVDLHDLKLDRIVEGDGSTIRVGASVRLSELDGNDAVRKRPALGAIIDSVRSIHPVQVKNLATVGGAVCSSIPFFDLPVGLAAVGASVEVRGQGGAAKSLPIEEFMADFLSPDLEAGEFVSGVAIDTGEYSTSAFAKFALTSNDWAIVNCACSFKVEGGSIAMARVIVGGVSSRLVAAHRTAERLRGLVAEPGRQFDDAVETLDEEMKDEDIVSDYRASADYRRRLMKVLFRESLDKALTRERG